MKGSEAQKSLLRKRMILKRKGMTISEIEEKSAVICRRVLANEQFAYAGNVLLYLPVGGEVDTKCLLAHFQKKKAGVFLPAYFKEEKKWIISKFEGLDNLKAGPFGIMQPREATIPLLPSLGLAIVPIVAFSPELDRLGWGKGVYDRLLGKFKTTKVGLAYESQMVKKLFTAPHDIKMDCVVTEKKIYGKIV
ncbi:MAG: 5-formyltetrahydrofolate cyclo-ligase [Candidatus Curtissbacteria bacterium GW2011_GWA1_40_16]|uniref:5-formyltetrahydrofolate cyclo-ligase n=1 Tax=Candidatus Curtissbacteria bacterium GW2011_GWA1_40_16 TaxID=1618405 RepID=A0A0G0TW67_9BACT|nr:MAG: 5-formyltetrahydrofolate cyclo-ligase [Candidatus Curtissbacteria bacterium GW2011_GWA1_40_16]